MFNTHILYLSINSRSSSLDLRSSKFAFGLKHYLCLVWCVGSGWALQGPRHGRFQLLRLGLHCLGVSGAARGCGAIAMAGGSAFARLCAIANLCGQRSTTGEQRRVAEESVSCICEMVPMETILGSDALMFRCSTPISYIYDLTLWCSLTILVHALEKYGCDAQGQDVLCAFAVINMAFQLVPYSHPPPLHASRARPDPSISVTDLTGATYKAMCDLINLVVCSGMNNSSGRLMISASCVIWIFI